MRRYSWILFLLSLTACAPGFLVDKRVSRSYYKWPWGIIQYSPNGNWFELGFVRCLAHKRTFRVVSEAIARDKTSIYYLGRPAPGVDYASFRVDRGVPKDRDFIYVQGYPGLKPVRVADPASFVYLNFDTLHHTWARDTAQYYFKLRPIRVDYGSFRRLNTWFYRDRDSLYADLGGWRFGGAAFLPDSDAVSGITAHYVRAGKAIYYVRTDDRYELLKTTFPVIRHTKALSADVIVVDDVVLFAGRVVPASAVNVASFALFPAEHDYARDHLRVYFRGQVIAGAEPASFLPLSSRVGKDRYNVYYEAARVLPADAATFVRDRWDWTDKNNRYKLEQGRLVVMPRDQVVK